MLSFDLWPLLCLLISLFQSLLKSKALIRSSFIKLLEEANEEECKLLEERWLSEECMTAIMEFMQRKSI